MTKEVAEMWAEIIQNAQATYPQSSAAGVRPTWGVQVGERVLRTAHECFRQALFENAEVRLTSLRAHPKGYFEGGFLSPFEIA